MDVLENGPASPYASYFGINWGSSSETVQDKIFLPILGDPYGRVLDKGEFKLTYDEGGILLELLCASAARWRSSAITRILKPGSEPLLGIHEFCLLLESLERLPAADRHRMGSAGEPLSREGQNQSSGLWALSKRIRAGSRPRGSSVTV